MCNCIINKRMGIYMYKHDAPGISVSESEEITQGMNNKNGLAILTQRGDVEAVCQHENGQRHTLLLRSYRYK